MTVVPASSTVCPFCVDDILGEKLSRLLLKECFSCGCPGVGASVRGSVMGCILCVEDVLGEKPAALSGIEWR